MAQPVTPGERNGLIDRVRGFALIGVLIANFIGYAYSEIPEQAALAKTTSWTPFLMQVYHTVFEWKFMTLFSILFGYGFGLIISSMERKGIRPTVYFLRRMSVLFILGVLHSLFWWGDVLHLYAFCGIFLLLFRTTPDRFLLYAAVCCFFIIPPFLSIWVDRFPEGFSPENVDAYYTAYLQENWIQLFKANLTFNYKAFVSTSADLHDGVLTLGRFLLGYWLMRKSFFLTIANNHPLQNRLLLIFSVFTVGYCCLKAGNWHFNPYLKEALLTAGIFSASSFYALLLIRLISWKPDFWFFTILEKTGRMTLTNYLSVSFFAVFLLYGIGLGRMEYTTLPGILLWAVFWYVCMACWSYWWLKRFRFGPMEKLWRKLTYLS